MEGLVLIGTVLFIMWIIGGILNGKDTWWEHYQGKKMSGEPLEDETFVEFLTGEKNNPPKPYIPPIKEKIEPTYEIEELDLMLGDLVDHKDYGACQVIKLEKKKPIKKSKVTIKVKTGFGENQSDYPELTLKYDDKKLSSWIDTDRKYGTYGKAFLEIEN
jgi:hypothetical protein